MKFVTCTYNGPDGDGDLNFELELAHENKSDHDIELLKSSVLFLNENGIAIAGTQDDENETFIEPGETEEFSAYAPWCSINDFGGKVGDVEVIVDTTFFRCEFHKLGEHELPSSPDKPVYADNSVDIGGMLKSNGVGIYLGKPDEDGEVGLEVRVGLRNLSEIHFDKIELKVELIDKRGNEIDESTDYNSAPAFSGRILTPSMYGLKPSRLKGCSVKLSLSIYQPIAFESVVGKLEKEK